MDRLVWVYIIIWTGLSIVAALLMIRDRKDLLLFKKEYCLFLMKKWKILSFLIATALLSYTSTLWYDPTWDVPETFIMSILTYCTAPYTVGTFYRFIRWFHRSLSELYIAIILLLFSSAWFYDAYAAIFLIWTYPSTAIANLWLSPFFYILAGMMWSMDYKKDSGTIFVYSEQEWVSFQWDANSFWKIIVYILPIVSFMVVVFWYFIYLNS